MAAQTGPFCGAELKAEVLGGLCSKCVLHKVMAEPEGSGHTPDEQDPDAEGGGSQSGPRSQQSTTHHMQPDIIRLFAPQALSQVLDWMLPRSDPPNPVGFSDDWCRLPGKPPKRCG